MVEKATLIADSGSTKTTWALLSGGKREIVRTQGLSPYFLDGNEIREIILEELVEKMTFDPATIHQIYFYGTGVSAKEKSKMVEEALQPVFPQGKIEINHDLTGAARALCQHEEGIACILGTGSGACYYDGKKIQHISPGLGFILGDEGSGADLGKMLIQKYLYKELNDSLIKRFDETYGLSKAEILEKVYKGSHPSRFLASFSRFLGKYRAEEEVKKMVETSMRNFLCRHVRKYAIASAVPVHFVGGVASAFSRQLHKVCHEEGLHCGRISKNPMDGLVDFHKK